MQKSDPSLLAQFRALRLNQGVDDTLQSTILDADVWQGVEGEAEHSGPYVLGIDLGSSASMSAAAMYAPDTGAFDAIGCFPTIPDLARRGLSDGVGPLYANMLRRGELMLAGGRVADVPALLSEVLERWGRPAAVVADRWRVAELADALDSIRFPSTSLVRRGQGYRDGGEDIRDFRRAVLGGRVTPRKSLLMRSAMGAARVSMDAAGNAKLAKFGAGKRARSRDDAASAAILSIAVGEREARAAPRRTGGVYLGTI